MGRFLCRKDAARLVLRMWLAPVRAALKRSACDHRWKARLELFGKWPYTPSVLKGANRLGWPAIVAGRAKPGILLSGQSAAVVWQSGQKQCRPDLWRALYADSVADRQLSDA